MIREIESEDAASDEEVKSTTKAADPETSEPKTSQADHHEKAQEVQRGGAGDQEV